MSRGTRVCQRVDVGMSCFAGAEDEALGEQKRQNKIIDAQLKRDKDVYRATHQVLLLGASGSGTSTILKQMIILHKDRFSDTEREEKVKLIRTNVKDVILALTQAMSQMDPPVEFANPKNKERYEYLLEHATKPGFNYPPEFFEICTELWKDEGVIACYQRSNEFQLTDCAAYFMDEDKLKELATPGYKPSDQDIVRCHCDGIFETRFMVDKVRFYMIDVSGQRIKRRKWIRCFNDVTVIIFVIDCSSFNTVIREDGKTNRLQESLELFESLWNNQWLQAVSFILFLNKQDLLKKKVEFDGQNVADYFPAFSSYQPPQDAFDKREPGDSDTFIRAKHFFREQFLQLTQMTYDGLRSCYPFFTTSIDTENIRRVFDSCRDIIQRLHLKIYKLL